MINVFSYFMAVIVLAVAPILASENAYMVKATAYEKLDRQSRVYLMLDRDDLFLYKYSRCPDCFSRLVKELEGWKENDPIILAASTCKKCQYSLVVENLRQRGQVILDLDEKSLDRLPQIEAIYPGDLLTIALSNGTEWQVRREKENFYGSIWKAGDRLVISEDVAGKPVLINMDQAPTKFSRHPIAWAYGYNLRQLAVSMRPEE